MVTDGLNPLTLLLFLGLVGGSLAAGLVWLLAALTGRRPLARRIATLELAGLGAYAMLLAGASLFSRERVLARGDEKHLCEVDCHHAYAVVGVRSAETDGSGTSYVVTVRVRFDEETISAHRGMGPLTPNGRRLALIDDRGRRYPGSDADLHRTLIPGQSYTTDLTFNVPHGTTGLRLLLTSGDWETRLLINHENSLLHAKTIFRLDG